MIKTVFIGLAFCQLAMIPAESVNLTVKVSGFDGSKGNLVLAIYRSTDTFPSTSNTYKNATVAVDKLVDGKYTIHKLPKNTYAVAVYQDVNKNGKLDKNLFGVPTERYGFSNNARGTFSAPSFSEAKVSVQGDKTISIDIY